MTHSNTPRGSNRFHRDVRSVSLAEGCGGIKRKPSKAPGNLHISWTHIVLQNQYTHDKAATIRKNHLQFLD